MFINITCLMSAIDRCCFSPISCVIRLPRALPRQTVAHKSRVRLKPTSRNVPRRIKRHHYGRREVFTDAAYTSFWLNAESLRTIYDANTSHGAATSLQYTMARLSYGLPSSAVDTSARSMELYSPTIDPRT